MRPSQPKYKSYSATEHYLALLTPFGGIRMKLRIASRPWRDRVREGPSLIFETNTHGYWTCVTRGRSSLAPLAASRLGVLRLVTMQNLSQFENSQRL
jgi:hypothetical protein